MSTPSSSSPLTKVVFIKRVLLFGASCSSVYNLVSLGTVSSSWYDAFYNYHTLADILIKDIQIEPSKSLYVDSIVLYRHLVRFFGKDVTMKNILLSRCSGDPRLIRFLREVFFPDRLFLHHYQENSSSPSLNPEFDPLNNTGDNNRMMTMTLVANPAKDLIQIVGTEDHLKRFTSWRKTEIPLMPPAKIAVAFSNIEVLNFLLKRSEETIERFCKQVIKKYPNPLVYRQKFFWEKKKIAEVFKAESDEKINTTGSSSSSSEFYTSILPFELEARNDESNKEDTSWYNLTSMLRCLMDKIMMQQFSRQPYKEEKKMPISGELILHVMRHYSRVKKIIDRMAFEGIIDDLKEKNENNNENDSDNAEHHQETPFRIPYNYDPTLHFLCISGPGKLADSANVDDAYQTFVIGKEQQQLMKNTTSTKWLDRAQKETERPQLGFLLHQMMSSLTAFPDDVLKELLRIFINDFKWSRELRETGTKMTILQMAGKHERLEVVKFLVEEMRCNPFATRRYQSMTMTTIDVINNSRVEGVRSPEEVAERAAKLKKVVDYLGSISRR